MIHNLVTEHGHELRFLDGFRCFKVFNNAFTNEITRIVLNYRYSYYLLLLLMAPITQYLVTELPQIFGTVNKRTSNNKSGEKDQKICEICVGKLILTTK